MPKPLNLSIRGTRLTREKWEQIQILWKKQEQIQIKRTIIAKHCSSFGSRIYNETKWMTSTKHGINRNAIHGRLYLNFCTESTKILIRTAAAAVWVYPLSGPCPKTVSPPWSVHRSILYARTVCCWRSGARFTDFTGENNKTKNYTRPGEQTPDKPYHCMWT